MQWKCHDVLHRVIEVMGVIGDRTLLLLAMKKVATFWFIS